MDLLNLIQQDGFLRKVSHHDGGEWAGPCPKCGGVDRFRCWPESSRSVKFWCRGCLISGDVIDYLRKVRGLSFRDACRAAGKDYPPLRLVVSRRTTQAEGETLRDYYTWEHEQLRKWTDAYRALLADKEEAEIAVRATRQSIHLYTGEEEAYWLWRLVAVKTELEESALIPTMADIFTYDEHRQERFLLWQKERKSRP